MAVNLELRTNRIKPVPHAKSDKVATESLCFALAPFAAVARGIPNYWPTEHTEYTEF